MQDFLPRHYAMIGMAAGQEAFPLYAEAVNEQGLCMAGLNFPGSAYYRKTECGKTNIGTFEFIPWILGRAHLLKKQKKRMKEINITDDAFSEDMPPRPAPLDAGGQGEMPCGRVGQGRHKVYEDSIGILTNNPPFEYHRMNLNNYLSVTAGYPQPRFSQWGNGEKDLCLKPYSQGMGGIGLPGDYSSASRFVKAAFLKWNAVCGENEEENVSQVFHILDSVAMPRGAVITQDGKYDITTYSCCVNADTGTYYYKTYGNSQINSVEMRIVDPDGNTMIIYPMETGQSIRKIN